MDVEKSSLVERYVVSTEKYAQIFRRSVLPSSSGSSRDVGNYYIRWNTHELLCHYAAVRTSNMAKWDVLYVSRLFWAVICTGIADAV